jgi:hypothetical protein
MYVVIRGDVPPETLAESIRREIWSVDPDQPAQGGADWPLEGWVAGWFARTRFAASLLVAFSAVAFVMAAAGVFSVVTFDVGTI